MTFTPILGQPRITEKATRLANAKTYALTVDINANKNQVTHAIEQLYDVTVDHVRTTIRKGRVVHVGRKRSKKRRPDTKIAYITLKNGTLDVIPNA